MFKPTIPTKEKENIKGTLQKCNFPNWALNKLKIKNNHKHNTNNHNQQTNNNKSKNLKYESVPENDTKKEKEKK